MIMHSYQQTLRRRDAEIIRLKTELAELRDAVEWHFECEKLFNYDRSMGFAVGIAYMEFRATGIEAEAELRRLGGGGDV